MQFSVIDTTPYLTEEAKALLEQHHCQVRHRTLAELPVEQFCREIEGAHAVLASGEWWTRRVLEAGAANQLQIVARTGAGVDCVDVQAAAELGIWVTNTPTATTHAVADFTLGLILSLLRHIPKAIESVRNRQWERPRGKELASLTLGVIGTGAIGREVIKRVVGFGGRVLGYDVAPDEKFSREYRFDYVGLDELLAASDIVSLHCSLNENTKGLIDKKRLSLMKEQSYLINTSRPAVVDKPALVAALKAKDIAGAAIDVHDPMPCAPDDPLLALENVLITPWIAYNTVESVERMCITASRDVVAVLNGRRPEFPVNSPK